MEPEMAPEMKAEIITGNGPAMTAEIKAEMKAEMEAEIEAEMGQK